MKRMFIVALLCSVLVLSMFSVCRGASSIAGEKVYYDGKIVVTSKGADDQKNVFNESVTISDFKIEHWNVIPGQIWWGYDSGTGCNADIAVSDQLGETSLAFGPKKVRFKQGLISLNIRKDGGKYLYSMQVTPPHVQAGNLLVPFLWLAKTCDTVGDDFLPLEISGKMTMSVLDNGVPTTVTWVLSRHIR